MNTETILHASDMTVPRRVAEFVAWVQRKTEDLGASLAAKTYAWAGAAWPKKFYDEIYPLALFVEHELAGTPEATVTPNLNRDNFDATISLGGGRGTRDVEVTCVKDGDDESRRDAIRTREGSVNRTGPIVKTEGRRGAPDRLVKVRSAAIRHDILLAQHLSLVAATVQAKANRVYGPRPMWWLVVDDDLACRELLDDQSLDALVTPRLLSSELDFARLVVLGVSGNLFLSYRLPKYANPEPALSPGHGADASQAARGSCPPFGGTGSGRVRLFMLEGCVSDAMPRVGDHRESGMKEFVDV